MSMRSFSIFFCAIVLFIAVAESLIGQSRVVTVAGGMPAEAGSTSTISLRAVQSIGFNLQGSLFLAENFRIFRLEPGDPDISVFAKAESVGDAVFGLMQ